MLNSAFRLSLAIALVAAGLMAAVTNGVSTTLLGDERTRAPLYILALSLPFMAVTSCLKGAFMAYRKVLVPSSNSLFEQIIKTCSTNAVLRTVYAERNRYRQALRRDRRRHRRG